jgi:hypothetical protein
MMAGEGQNNPNPEQNPQIGASKEITMTTGRSEKRELIYELEKNRISS